MGVGLVHVHTRNIKINTREVNVYSEDEQTQGVDENESTEILQKYLSVCAHRGMKTKIYTKAKEKTDSVGQTICALIKENEPSMIVMGQRGLGVLRRALFGSVSEYITHHAHIPTLVIPKEKIRHLRNKRGT